MFILNWLSAHWLELFGVLTGIGSVLFLAKNKAVLGWGFAIVNAVFFIVLMLQAHLYADFTLNVYYLVTSIWGFYIWKFGRKAPVYEGEVRLPKKITHLTWKGWVLTIAIVVVGTLLFGTFLRDMTDASFPMIDSMTTVMSFVGQFLLARKVFDNWYIWIAADVVDIGLYFVKGLFLVSAMTGIFMVLCVMGIVIWRRVEAKERAVDKGQPLIVRSVA